MCVLQCILYLSIEIINQLIFMDNEQQLAINVEKVYFTVHRRLKSMMLPSQLHYCHLLTCILSTCMPELINNHSLNSTRYLPRSSSTWSTSRRMTSAILLIYQILVSRKWTKIFSHKYLTITDYIWPYIACDRERTKILLHENF